MDHFDAKTKRLESVGFTEFCRTQSQSQLRSLARVENVQVSEGKFGPNNGNESQWVSVIFVSSGAIRLIFKTQYQESDVIGLAKSAFASDKVSEEKTKDFVKEFCNVSAGAIKQTFEPKGHEPSRMSLPIVTRSADNIFFEAKGSPFIFEDSWVLSTGENKIACAIIVEFIDKLALQKILLPAFGADDDGDGDVEFL